MSQNKSHNTNPQEKSASPIDEVVSALGKWKELISIVIFFSGCVVWITGYFATKKQLADLKCFAKESIAVVQSESKIRTTSDDWLAKSEKLSKIKTRPVLSESDRNDLIRLEREIKDLDEQYTEIKRQYANAQKKLIDGICSQD